MITKLGAEPDNVTRLVDHKPAAIPHEGPLTLDKMSDTEVDAYLIGLRERRMQAQRVLKEANAKKAEIQELANKLRLDKKCAQVQKQVEAVDKHIDKLEQLVMDLRALRLQYE